MNELKMRLLQHLVIKGDCWEWGLSRFKTGYGQISVKDRPSYVHRVAWIVVNGEIPDGLCVLHHCDNRACLRPSHLFLGTKADNTADMIRKGRWRQPHRPTKLNPVAVIQIRKLLALGTTPSVLAAQFGVCTQNIRDVASRKTWKHIGAGEVEAL